MQKRTITVEDIERKQRLLAMLFKVFVAILILIGCLFVGWLISFVGYAEELRSLIRQPVSGILSLTDYSIFFA